MAGRVSNWNLSDYSGFGKILRKARKDNNEMTYAAIAELLDLHPQWYPKAERNGQNPNPETLDKLIHRLNLDVVKACRSVGRLPKSVHDLIMGDEELLRRLWDQADPKNR